MDLCLFFFLKFAKKSVLMPSITILLIPHSYHTGFSQSNFGEGNSLPSQTKFAVSLWGPRLWNKFLNQEQKNMTYVMALKCQ